MSEKSEISNDLTAIPECFGGDVADVAFDIAVDLHDVRRFAGLTEAQVGFVLGLAGRVFLMSMSGETQRVLTVKQVRLFADAISEGLANNEARFQTEVGIDSINDMLADDFHERGDPAELRNMTPDEQKMAMGQLAGDMAIADFDGGIQSGFASLGEVAFIHGLSLKMLISLINQMGLGKEGKAQSKAVVDKFLSGFSQDTLINITTEPAAGDRRKGEIVH